VSLAAASVGRTQSSIYNSICKGTLSAGFRWILNRKREKDLNGEIWKTVRVCEAYEVSNKGRVRHKGKESIRKLDNSTAYPRVRLRDKIFLVHLLVANEFCEKHPSAQCVHHVNADTTDNRAENLQWVTYAKNAKEAGKKRRRLCYKKQKKE